jgi:bifunctional oligoribonuclease and PAP phosphatase NrnA
MSGFDLDAVIAEMAKAEELVLTCHVGPDGDALGSLLGVAWLARRQGKRVYASFGEPFTIPEAYRFLPVDLLVPPGAVPAEPGLMMSFDAGSLDRLGVLAEPAGRAKTLVVVDHHASNPGFGTLNLIDPKAAATAEICVQLMAGLGWELDEVSATCFHAGLVTDTGRFQYSNTSPSTLRVAATLVEAGARPEIVGRHVYEEVPFGYLHLASTVLGRASLDPELRLVWSWVSFADLATAGIGMDDTDPLIDAVRVARESDVAMLLKEAGQGRVKVSLRSRGRVDVGAIAVAFGGGGHHNAAGFTFTGSIEAAVEAVRGRLSPAPPDAG